MNATLFQDFFPTPAPIIKKIVEGLDLNLIEDVLDLGAVQRLEDEQSLEDQSKNNPADERPLVMDRESPAGL